jgi:HD-like signal output (HDOD) protein
MSADSAILRTRPHTPDEIVRDVHQLPSAPKVLPRLKALLGDGNSSMYEIVGLVRLDLGIAARVLQVANSAFYSKGARCLTVDEAVNRVGYDQVYELVAYAVGSQVLVRPLGIYGIEADDLWKQSVSCALAAEILALHTGLDRNVAYTNGLLHCVGMVAIDDWASRNRPGITLESNGFPREFSESERAEFGFTQADAGAALLSHWDFPREMSEPVRWQYAPHASAGYARMACLLHVAKWLRTSVCRGPGAKQGMPTDAQLQTLALSPALLRGMANLVALRLSEISSLLEVEPEPHREGRHRFPQRP